jgi:hypothetical protein
MEGKNLIQVYVKFLLDTPLSFYPLKKPFLF